MYLFIYLFYLIIFLWNMRGSEWKHVAGEKEKQTQTLATHVLYSGLCLSSLETMVVLSSWWEMILSFEVNETGANDSSFRCLNASSLAIFKWTLFQHTYQVVSSDL